MDVYLEHLRNRVISLRRVPTNLITEEMCWVAIERDSDAVLFVPHQLWTAEMGLEAIRLYGRSEANLLSVVPPLLRTQKVCLEAVRQNGLAILHVPDLYLTEKICLAAVRQNGEALQFVPPIRTTPNVCIAAVLQSGEALRYVPPGIDLGAIRPEAEEAADWERVKDAIRQHGVDMRRWHGDEWDPKSDGTCGTQHCIAGWAQALSTDMELRQMDPVDAGLRLLPRHARMFFKPELTREQILGIP